MLELGAGSGLPSLVAAWHRAACVVITDYPDENLISNISENAKKNVPNNPSVHVLGYRWGDSPQTLFDVSGGHFDVLLLCDLVFNWSEHASLLRSVDRCMSADGTVWDVIIACVADVHTGLCII